MQLRKPLVSRAEVKPEAVELMLKIVDAKWAELERKFRVRNKLYGQDVRLAALLRPLAAHDPEAIDRLVSDLKGMPYEKISASTHNGVAYLTGHTRPIVSEAYTMRNPESGQRRSGGSYYSKGYMIARYDLGQYMVAISVDAFLTNKMDRVHLIPDREPYTRQRHYHHLAYNTASPYDERHPLECSVSWCMASFGSIFMSLLGNLDFAGYFKILHRFLSIYNTDSPLCSHLPFERRLEE